MILIYIAIFALGFAADYITVEWHRAREAMAINRTAILSMALETLTWIPVMLFVIADDPIVALVSVVASGAGTRSGLRRVAREQGDPVVHSAITTEPARCAPALEDSLRSERPTP